MHVVLRLGRLLAILLLPMSGLTAGQTVRPTAGQTGRPTAGQAAVHQAAAAASAMSLAGSTRFVAESRRLLDTRWSVAVVPGGSVDVVMPAGATAVIVNLTAVDATGPGFWTAYPTGQTRPTASNINVSRAGQTIANMATATVGTNNSITVYSQSGGHLVVDLVGRLEPSSSSAAGRLVLSAGRRILDTRFLVPVQPGGVQTIDVGAPAATSAIVNITITRAKAAGFWSAGVPGRPIPPPTSTVNVTRANETVANQAIVPLVGGRFDIYAQSGGDLIIDLVGLVTGSTAAVSMDGLVVPLARPTRLIDTRTTSKLRAGWTQRIAITDASAGGVLGNLTAVEATAPGFLSVLPSSGTSALNMTGGQTIANHLAAAVASDGLVVESSNGSHVLFDLAAIVLGQRLPAVGTLPPNVRIEDVQSMLDQLAVEATARGTSMAATVVWRGERAAVRGTESRSSLSSAKAWWTAVALLNNSPEELWPFAEQIFTTSDDCAGGGMLFKAGGADAMNAQMRAWGIPSRTRLVRWLNCGPHLSTEFTGLNVFTTDDGVSFLRKLRAGELLPPDKTATLLEWLRLPADRLNAPGCDLCGSYTHLLPLSLAEATMHKTGWTDPGDKHTHMAIVPYGHGDLFAAIATTGSIPSDAWTIGQLGCRLHRLVGDPTHAC